jgi:hypothetical protein
MCGLRELVPREGATEKVTLTGNFLFLLFCDVSIETVHRVNGMINECGAAGGMRIGRGNRSTRRKPIQVPL